MKKTKRQNGITLVALVITIIILLILATISIQSLTNTGLFAKAQEAKEKTRNAEENQARTLNEYENELNKYISGNVKTPIKKVTDNIGSVLSTIDNTELEDAYGNKIVVPAGFKIVSNSDTNNATTVDKGIVIEDATSAATAGSQFVWVPVGKIYTDEQKTESKTKTIILGRYDFDATTGAESAYSGSYVEEDKGNASTTLKNWGNTIAKNITNFKNSVTQNGGYYIGRYEARTTTTRNSKDDALTQITERGIDQVYNFVTQPQAAGQAQNMYNSSKFTSDLMNSYVWDTTITFIQKCTEQTNYSRQASLNSNFSPTGTTNDKQCNIFDMASNVLEWSTETSNYSDNNCVTRGGFRGFSDVYANNRMGLNTDVGGNGNGFRPILYLNV